jgi:hypothetical protein
MFRIIDRSTHWCQFNFIADHKKLTVQILLRMFSGFDIFIVSYKNICIFKYGVLAL